MTKAISESAGVIIIMNVPLNQMLGMIVGTLVVKGL